MTRSSHRLPAGGRLDRSTALAFTVDGRSFVGHPGDTLASALLANGVIETGPSIYRHRPRGAEGIHDFERRKARVGANRGVGHERAENVRKRDVFSPRARLLSERSGVSPPPTTYFSCYRPRKVSKRRRPPVAASLRCATGNLRCARPGRIAQLAPLTAFVHLEQVQ